MASNPRHDLVLMAGCPRSGTTLLNLIANTHPKVALTNEINLVSACYGMESLLFRPRRATDRKKSARENWNQSELPIPKQHPTIVSMLSAYCASIKQGVSAVSVVGDKLPTYLNMDLSGFAKHFNLRLGVIVVTRNPVDVISSMLRRARNSRQGTDSWKGPDNLIDAGNAWVDAWNNCLALKESDNVDVLNLNYNQFVTDPDEGSNVLARFLGLTNRFDVSRVSTADVPRDSRLDNLHVTWPELKALDSRWSTLPLVMPSGPLIQRRVQTSLERVKSRLKKMRMPY